ncbi:MAG: hypothetical protein EOR30_24315 [Mesorhizobium sp.]|uniref:hypothetical protein n=1 Tax=unclassified Mesorhizobium TaxID=325217 RepID=UPI000FCA7160|nr:MULTISPECIES: hypothetical protein [unclassified Mesorhizobium]RUV66814.1 hypothetical protein EOA78_32695 [Mesorhizobium sp. M5C.F.Cr.IN.023.01.1.1]RWF82875.1 MAG: hypothetical protein EOQ36_28375 [Mesorhizobium sp.]RWF89577.1 MAG: hypothetical protein EOQ45_30730 [Mesorhizobium sp.]RWI43549.1 MAG: hypothetical protein EOR14_02970 [Mesorhizobium sp.]RWI44374.1 MAG: hypothetical protein EOR15_26545 [Mesorhizobium sp.]
MSSTKAKNMQIGISDSALFALFARLCWPVGSEALLDRIAELTEKAVKPGKRGRRGKEKVHFRRANRVSDRRA